VPVECSGTGVPDTGLGRGLGPIPAPTPRLPSLQGESAGTPARSDAATPLGNRAGLTEEQLLSLLPPPRPEQTADNLHRAHAHPATGAAPSRAAATPNPDPRARTAAAGSVPHVSSRTAGSIRG
jgi:hypothetical protein